jgi:hypothetical protein
MFALKLILTSVIVAGVVVAFAGLVVDGKKAHRHIVRREDSRRHVRSPLVGVMEGAVSRLLDREDEILKALEDQMLLEWMEGQRDRWMLVIEDVRCGLNMLRIKDSARKVGK